MRERLTLSFVLVTLGLLVVAGLVRSVALDGMQREREGEHIFREATTLAAVVEARQERREVIDAAFLDDYVGADTAIVFVPAPNGDGGDRVEVRGPAYEPGEGEISSTVTLDDGDLTVRQSADAIGGVFRQDVWSLVVLFLLVGVVSALIGFAISRALSAPFQRLAVAASALGRGRFDLDLPETRVPEARAISEALRTSAVALRDRLEREQAFSMHASHVLRTPLTRLRLELEELALDPELPEAARSAVVRGMSAVDEVNEVAGELVSLSRQGLIGGEQVPLRELATGSAQVWADELADLGRGLTAAVEGDLELTFTPGPIEQILDLLLRHVVRHGTGDARLVFEGDSRGHLRITVGAARLTSPREELLVEEARSVVEALGGRLQSDVGDDTGIDLSVLLPRR
ncbi:hypothetical protein NPS01_31240 [Nocardioides psychrotolerans]|uniref:histidine kinase n=1 Tax=Nocardioides psychrotolerans TaxID=1005945 RepID=A0A1I3MDE1_9ACTN|nr:HAMP domain-containing protein [Nocardioides psychrotolerans]GEP39461.1 hypothetical protein NPS01_31240 [Nocardioides psychrotolerans]SFI94988.1 HAMP domain-containing protein [Nocardioides psychrotolerans]